MVFSRDIRPRRAGDASEFGEFLSAGTGMHACGIDFGQDHGAEAFEWDVLLDQFIRRYGITFLKLELLMMFYRGNGNPVRAEEISARTGYHPREVSAGLAKLASDGLLGEQRGEDGPSYRRLDTGEFSGRGRVRHVLQRMVEDFAQRDGRLRIIYTLLKAREDAER